jgi:hypothetical protein
MMTRKLGFAILGFLLSGCGSGDSHPALLGPTSEQDAGPVAAGGSTAEPTGAGGAGGVAAAGGAPSGGAGGAATAGTCMEGSNVGGSCSMEGTCAQGFHCYGINLCATDAECGADERCTRTILDGKLKTYGPRQCQRVCVPTPGSRRSPDCAYYEWCDPTTATGEFDACAGVTAPHACTPVSLGECQ